MCVSKLYQTVDSFEFILRDILPQARNMETILSLIGLAFIGKYLLSTVLDLIIGFRAHFLSRILKKNLVESYGKWAVVTGCTDGIGKAYMKELAKRGLNIVLVSRSAAKLEACAKEIRDEYGVETEIVQVDFSEGRPIYGKIEKAIQNKDIGILVNNVGVMLDKPKALISAREDEIWSHVNVNVASIPVMMKMVLPSMVRRKKGAIVNLASIAAIGPLPYMGIYAASKAFVDFMSEATNQEYKDKGITIQTLYPSYVATNMTKFHSFLGKANIFVPDATTFARSAVNTLGYTESTTGFWPMGIQIWSCQFITRPMFMFSMKLANIFLANGKVHDE